MYCCSCGTCNIVTAVNVIRVLFDRSILTVPWIELGGMVTITCPKTGYSAQIDFETKVRSLITPSCLYRLLMEFNYLSLSVGFPHNNIFEAWISFP